MNYNYHNDSYNMTIIMMKHYLTALNLSPHHVVEEHFIALSFAYMMMMLMNDVVNIKTHRPNISLLDFSS